MVDPDVIEFLYRTFHAIAEEKGFEITACKILEEHVHCLIGFDSIHRPNYIIRIMKGASSREFFKTFQTNRFIYRKLWARGYYGEQISNDNLNSKIKYINDNIDETGFDKRYKVSGISK